MEGSIKDRRKDRMKEELRPIKKVTINDFDKDKINQYLKNIKIEKANFSKWKLRNRYDDRGKK